MLDKTIKIVPLRAEITQNEIQNLSKYGRRLRGFVNREHVIFRREKVIKLWRNGQL